MKPCGERPVSEIPHALLIGEKVPTTHGAAGRYDSSCLYGKVHPINDGFARFAVETLRMLHHTIWKAMAKRRILGP